MMGTRFTRLKSQGMVGGVCAGLGDYLRIDASFIRIFFVLLTFAEGIGVIAYLVLWLVIPGEAVTEQQSLEATIRENANELSDRARSMRSDFTQGFEGTHPQLPLYIGGGLVLLGVAYLIDNLHLSWLAWLRSEFMWPLLLILAGVVLLVRRNRGE